MAALISIPAFVAGSWRDRSSRVFEYDQRVFRALDETAACDWRLITGTSFFRAGTAAGEIIGTRASSEAGSFVCSEGYFCALEHDRIATISWPWEWSFSMLQDAALHG